MKKGRGLMIRVGLVLLMMVGLGWGREVKCRTVKFPHVVDWERSKGKGLTKWVKGLGACKDNIYAVEFVNQLEKLDSDSNAPIYAVEVRNASDDQLAQLGSWLKVLRTVHQNEERKQTQESYPRFNSYPSAERFE